MKNKKIKLEDLKVQSFVTVLRITDNNTVQGESNICRPEGAGGFSADIDEICYPNTGKYGLCHIC